MSALPTLESLNEAAVAMHMPDWGYLDRMSCDYRDELRDGAIAHARTLDQLHGRKPDPIEAAIEAAWAEYREVDETPRASFHIACRKHFAGLTFPVQP